MTPRKPNILFFFTDQQRWDTCGCYGQKLDVTPNLDRMASEGVRFENAFTCQPVCGPARACLQTGKYATETGCFRNGIALPRSERTIARILSEEGYETAYIGKWHLASGGEEEDHRTKPVPPGLRGGYKNFWLASDVLEYTSHAYGGHMFDADMNKVEFSGYRVDRETDFALEYLSKRKSAKPFFLMVSYLEPHHQNDENRYRGPDGSKERFAGYETPGDLKGAEGDWRENYPDYLGACASLDFNLGRIRSALDDLGILEDTLIIYSSDHGSHFRTRNSEYKRSCHEASIRIPLVLSGPGFEVGGVTGALSGLIDIPPTILKAAGAAIPASMRGAPLHDIKDGRHKREEVFVQISEAQTGRCLRTDRWKYSVRAPVSDNWSTPVSDIYIEDCLYDLKNDPFEKNNLVRDGKTTEIRKKLSGRLLEYIEEVELVKADISPGGKAG